MSGAVKHCSFCRKSQDEVRKLVFSTDASICDECVILCVDAFCDPDGCEDISDDIGNLPTPSDAALTGGEGFDPEAFRPLVNGKADRVAFELSDVQADDIRPLLDESWLPGLNASPEALQRSLDEMRAARKGWEGIDPSKGGIVPLAPSTPPLSADDVRAIVRAELAAERSRQVPFVMGPPRRRPDDAE